MIRLLNEVQEKPKYVLFENVSMITSVKFKDTLKIFKNDLENLGYTLHDKILNAKDYGIPQNRKRYFLIAILDNCKEFKFPEKIKRDIKLKDFIDKDVEEKYYLTNVNFKEMGDTRIFKNKNRDDIKYEVDMNKFLNGGLCGIDRHTKFAISSRLFSMYGIAPTITASNTIDNCKIVVE